MEELGIIPEEAPREVEEAVRLVGPAVEATAGLVLYLRVAQVVLAA